MAEGPSLPLPSRNPGNHTRGPWVPSLSSGGDPAMDCCAPLSFLPQSRPLVAKGQGNVLEDLSCSHQSHC